jgi:hypothetical protein
MSMEYLNVAGTFEGMAGNPSGGWLQRSKEKKTPFICIPVKVTGGEHSGRWVIYKGWLSDKALDATIKTLVDVFGFNGDLNALHAGTISFEGKRCQITTEIEEYEGKAMAKVRWLNPANHVHAAPKLEESDAKGLLAHLTARAKKAALLAGAAPSATPPVSEPPPKDDDIPF